MSYIIKYDYNTGDSFHTEKNVIRTLELKFESLDVAKDALRRIKEHYKFYASVNKNWRITNKEREAITKEASKQDWAATKNGKIQYDFCLVIKTDNGNSFQFSAPWCGFFERLNEAWIEKEGDLEDDDMRVRFN